MEIWGIDNNSSILNKAAERCKEKRIGNINLSLQNSYNLPFEDESFDTVVCINMLHNIESAELMRMTLSQMERVCKKEGMISEIHVVRFVGEFREVLKKSRLFTVCGSRIELYRY